MELNIRIAGAAGQGMATTAEMLGRCLTRTGLFAHCRNDAMSRIRGGLNFSHLRCSDGPQPGVSDEIDILIAHSEEALRQYAPLLGPEGVAVLQADWEPGVAPGLAPNRIAPFQLADMAGRAGNERASGTVALAVLTGLAGLDPGLVRAVLEERFESGDLLATNLKALEKGLAATADWDRGDAFGLPPGDGNGRLWLSGAQSIALGAVAGGVSFLAGYPMSPATGVMAALASFPPSTGVLVEQAEDEIAAINMVAGASFAGARAMTATSGGGLCLMTEGVSLAGMMETPMVIALAQRPGPATGLPTRVAQGDLNLVRFAGHGDFPRIALAPRDIPDCFAVTARAFDLAERFQGPVFVLTDQLLQDSQATVEQPETGDLPTERHLLTDAPPKGGAAYQRYTPAGDGISPLAAPGAGGRVVVADSDEHDAEGHMVEDAALASAMAAKRQAKAAAVAAAAWPPEVTDEDDSGTDAPGPVIVGWGSTYATLAEACDLLAAKGRPVRHVNLSWLWPLPGGELAALLDRASPLMVVEASTGCHLAGWLREVCLKEVDVSLSRLDGRPFTVAELVNRLEEEI